MKIINLTPHDVSLVKPDGSIETIAASGAISRLEQRTVVTGYVNDIPITENEYGEIQNLPDPQDGVIYIVSALVAGQCKGRDDVFIPNESIRDEKGRIIGCRSLGRIK